MLSKKLNIFVVSIVILFTQFTAVYSIICRDVSHAAWCLRELVKNESYDDINKFMREYLDEDPELLISILCEKKSGFGGQIVLFDVACRNQSFGDCDKTLNLLVSSLWNAYSKAGDEDGVNQKIIEWLCSADGYGTLFVKYCIDNISKLEDAKVHKLLDAFFEDLKLLGGIQIVQDMLCTSFHRGISMRQHICYTLRNYALPQWINV
jgi:hypothetical protein